MLLLLLSSAATADPLSVPKHGNKQAPTGYIQSGDHYVPSGTKCQGRQILPVGVAVVRQLLCRDG
jgi:hypothetical protein